LRSDLKMLQVMRLLSKKLLSLLIFSRIQKNIRLLVLEYLGEPY